MKFTEPYFENICNIGDLFLDEIFFEFESIPVLFLCRDKSNNRIIIERKNNGYIKFLHRYYN